MRIPRTIVMIVAAIVLALAVASVVFGAAVVRFVPLLGLTGGSTVVGEFKHTRIEPSQECSHCHLARHKAPLAGPCEDCHTSSTWLSERSHETTAMDAGQHVPLRCVQCHANPNVLPKPSCKSCHRTVAHRWEPDCTRCHTVKVWTNTPYELPKKHFELAEKHKALRCPDCHNLNGAKVPPPRCKECHKKHTKAFPLTAQHKKPRCAACHNVGAARDNLNKVSIKGAQCVSCHKLRHKGYPKCGACHTTKFAGTPYAHEAKWRLVGTHKKVACDKCHTDLQWEKTKGTACVSCHSVRHTGLTNCARCHVPTTFDQPTFRHASVFSLRGAHSSLACSKCHPRGDLGRVRGTTCVQCHGVRHGGLTACAKCHTTTSFKPSTFLHNTVWERIGAHTTTRCSACHPKNQYAKTKGRDCVQCHGGKHAGQTRCGTCHTTFGWAPIKIITHSAKYPLYGQHRFVDCRACHKILRFAGTPNRCNDCHADLAHCTHTNCESCHTPRSWSRILPHDMKDCQ